MTDAWRKLPRSGRPYNAYERARYVEPGCDHAASYCKCDPPMWLREPSEAEQKRWPVNWEVVETEEEQK